MSMQSNTLQMGPEEKRFFPKMFQNPRKRGIAIAGGVLLGVLISGAIARESLQDYFTYPECRTAGRAACVNAKTQESVVSIKTEHGSGSGVVIAPRRILTNAHVVGNEPTVNVELADGSQVAGRVIGFARAGVDLALVEVQGGDELRPLALAAPDSIQVGTTAFASGDPLDRGQTFTQGIVSQISPRWIQSDAAINPGNSGGALLNDQGDLIGLVTAKLRNGEGIGLATPLDRIQEFLEAAATHVPPRTEALPLPPDLLHDPTILMADDTPLKGQLTEASNPPLEDGSYFDVYILEGKANQEITITMSSLQLNPYLILLAPDGSKMVEGGASRNQDARNAVLQAQLPADGTYIIFANSRNAEEVGSYSIRVSTQN